MRQSSATIEKTLRQEMVRGIFAPGKKIPTQIELQERFQASRGTIHKALQKLAADGFIKSNKKGGTEVVGEPAYLKTIGFVFPCRANEGVWPPYWHLIHEHVQDFTKKNSAPVLNIYYAGQGDINHPDYKLLAADVLNHLISGLVFVSMPLALTGKPPLTEEGISRAAVMDAPIFEGHTRGVWFDYRTYLKELPEWFIKKGCRRVALINALEGGLSAHDQKVFLDLLKKEKIRCEKKWIHSLSIYHLSGIPNLIHLLFSEKQEERPDAIYIADDTLTDAVFQAIQTLPAPVRHKIKILAHANFPRITKSLLKPDFIGFDSRKLFTAILNTVREKKSTNPDQPTLELIPPEFLLSKQQRILT